MRKTDVRTDPRAHPSGARMAVAILAVTALGGLGCWVGLAGANTQPGPSGVTSASDGVVTVDDTIRVNMRGGTQVTTTHVSVAPGGHTAWHYHPGPHVVAVTSGPVTVYETDCTVRGTFESGQGFFDPGSVTERRVHTLHNPGPDVAELVITDFREPGQPLTIAVVPQPTAACFE